jgi:protein-S-isoprenylcysteine O-methyltransferase Ste14
MNTQPETTLRKQNPGLLAGVVARIATVAAFLVLNMGVLFLGAGRFDWTWAWVFLGICLASLTMNGILMFRISPETAVETVAERSRILETKGWDKVVSGLFGLALYLAVPLVAALDMRFGWTRQLPLAWNLTGAVALAAGLGLAGWAVVVNAYFSTAVRIQSNRGHTVCRSGPYRFVRHPGYVGFILQSLGTPLLLGSPRALIPGAAAAILMVIRTSLEDRALQAELTGYKEYVSEVRHRLLPGVW